MFRLIVNDDDGASLKVVAYTVELLLQRCGEMLLFVGIIGQGLKQHIADEFVCPW